MVQRIQKAYAGMQVASYAAARKLRAFKDEERGGSEIVAVVAVAAVAILLAFVFKDAVGGFITTVVSTFTAKVSL